MLTYLHYIQILQNCSGLDGFTYPSTESCDEHYLTFAKASELL